MLNCIICGASFRQPPNPTDSNAESRELVFRKQGQKVLHISKAKSEQEKNLTLLFSQIAFIVMTNFIGSIRACYIVRACHIHLANAKVIIHLQIIWTPVRFELRLRP
jgi:hypothetical protein